MRSPETEPDGPGRYLATVLSLDPQSSAADILRRRREFLGSPLAGPAGETEEEVDDAAPPEVVAERASARVRRAGEAAGSGFGRVRRKAAVSWTGFTVALLQAAIWLGLLILLLILSTQSWR